MVRSATRQRGPALWGCLPPLASGAARPEGSPLQTNLALVACNPRRVLKALLERRRVACSCWSQTQGTSVSTPLSWARLSDAATDPAPATGSASGEDLFIQGFDPGECAGMEQERERHLKPVGNGSVSAEDAFALQLQWGTGRGAGLRGCLQCREKPPSLVLRVADEAMLTVSFVSPRRS